MSRRGWNGGKSHFWTPKERILYNSGSLDDDEQRLVEL
jgi:hypothetical protein